MKITEFQSVLRAFAKQYQINGIDNIEPKTFMIQVILLIIKLNRIGDSLQILHLLSTVKEKPRTVWLRKFLIIMFLFFPDTVHKTKKSSSYVLKSKK